MRHLRLVTASDTSTAGRPSRGDGAPAGAGTRAAGAVRRTGPVRVPDDDDLTLVYVPARLVLALAGRCSCAQCCTAYAEHRPEPHDPRRRRTDDAAGTRAI